MKNLLFIAAFAMLVSCNSTPTETTESAPAERSIGFNTALPELKWHLGTEDAVQLVKDLDKLWAAENYDAMRPFFADTAVFRFPDGKVLESADAFIEMMKAEDKEAEYTWTFDYAYSVDLDPSRGGEHVQAGFTGSVVKDGEKKKDMVHESYYIIEGKIVMWNQFKMDVMAKEEK